MYAPASVSDSVTALSPAPISSAPSASRRPVASATSPQAAMMHKNKPLMAQFSSPFGYSFMRSERLI